MPKSPDNQPALKAFGKRLRFLRSVENLTQSELAERADISFEHVNKLERGASGPSFAVVCSLAEALETHPANLFLFAHDGDFEESNAAERLEIEHNIPGVDCLDWQQFISHCGYFQMDLTNGAMYWSEGLYRLLGYATGEIAADHETLLKRHTPESWQSEYALRWQQLLQGQDQEDHELHFLRKDGEQRLGWIHIDYELDPSGKPAQAVGIVLDLTELRRMEGFLLQNQIKLEAMVRMRTAHRDEVIRELKEKTEDAKDKARTLEEVLQKYEETYQRYKRLYHDAPVGFASLDNLGIIQEGNPAAWELLGNEPQQLVGADLASLLDIDPAKLDARLERVFELGQSVVFEAKTVHDALCGERHLRLQLAPSHTEEERTVCLAAISDISERKWMEQALAEVNEHYRVMVEESGDAICMVSKNANGDEPSFLYANNVFCACFGLSVDSRQHTFSDLLQRIHPEHRDQVRQLCMQHLEGQAPPKRLEVRLEQNPETWLEFYAGSIVVGGQPAMLGGFRDITRSKRNESRLQQSEARMRTIYDAMPLYISIWRLQEDDFILAEVNMRAQQFAPYVYDYLGMQAGRFFQDNPQTLELLWACHNSGQQQRKTLSYAMHEGNRQELMHIIVTPLAPDEVMLLAEDADPKRNGLAQLELERNRLQALLELSGMQQRPLRAIMDHVLKQAVALTASEYGYIYLMDVKEQRLQLFAWNEAALRDCSIKNPRKAYLVRDTGLWGEAVRKRRPCIANDYQNSPLRQGTPEGHVSISRHCNIPAIRGGRIKAVLGVANKAREYTQNDLRMMELLMERVLDLWDEKINRGRLRAAKRAAEQANQNKSRHLAHISHEIRTPLNGLLGMLHLLRKTTSTPDQSEYIDNALQAGADLLHIVNNVLDFSSIESGKALLSPEPCDIRQLLQKTIDLYEARLRHKDLALQLDVHEDVPQQLLLDPLRMGQVLRNLLDNAVKFTEQGRVDIRLTMLQGNPEPELELRVSDTGYGIPESFQQNLFQPFQRLTGPGDTVPGTGLGLSIVQKLVQLMGGGVSVQSDHGRGTTFICRVPAIAVPREAWCDQAYATAEAPSLVLAEDPPHYGRRRVLIADDDLLSRKVLEELMKRHGHETHTASNGREALELADAHAFDLVFMDVQMPVMDGLETLERIRAGNCAHCPPDVPIVALTACALKGDRERLLEKGMDDYIAKPLDVQLVLETLQRFWERK